MKLALLIVGWLAALEVAVAQCGPSGCVVAKPPAAAGPRAHASIARVIHHEAGGNSIGSGTLIASDARAGYVLTCAHLFESEGQTEVQLAGRSLPARIVAMDRQHDLVLLETVGDVGRAVEVAELTAGGELSACGFGSTGELRCVRGPVTGFSTASGAAAPSVRVRGAVRSGDSGGPVFDAGGRLVAVVWGQRSGETYAMGGEPLRRLLAKLPPRELTPVARTPLPDTGGESDRSELPPLTEKMEERLKRLESLSHSAPATGVDGSLKSGPLHPLERAAASPQEPTTPVVGGRALDALLAWAGIESLFAALAVGGPLGLAAWAAYGWLRRQRRGAGVVRSETRTIAVDTPPPPQQVVPETHYVPYERDDFARAYQWASEQLARKFPGSVELLTSLDSLIRQQLNGKS